MRKHLVKTAAYWYNAGVALQSPATEQSRVNSMIQAYNHVENALAHILEKVPGAREEFERINGKIS